MRALIAAAGKPPGTSLLRQAAAASDLIIAADGGYRYLLEAGIEPNLLVGDFDSLPLELVKRAQEAGVAAASAPAEKDFTDTEYAVQLARERGADDILLLGATGGRMDHFLGNMAVLAACDRDGISARIEDDTQTIFVISGNAVIEGQTGDTVSLLPAEGSAVVHASGLYYPLEGLLLTNKAARGVSNVLTEPQAKISTTSPLYVIKVKMPPTSSAT